MNRPVTPVPVRTVRRLSVLLTAAATFGVLMSFSESDGLGRDHVFSALQRSVRSVILKLTTLDEAEAAAMRAAKEKKRRESS